MKQPVLGTDNKEKKKIDLDPAIFKGPVRRQLLFDVVQATLRNRRKGTVKAKTRGEVHGTTAKMYRQKGTGNARHGDAKANVFVGGGAAFPPLPRNWEWKIPQKAKQVALRSALALRKKEGNLILVENIPCKEIKTKTLKGQLAKWGFEKGVIVTEEKNEDIWKSARNLPGVRVVTSDSVSTFDILKYGKVLLTEKSLKKVEKRLS